jgi:hypothetical protein
MHHYKSRIYCIFVDTCSVQVWFDYRAVVQIGYRVAVQVDIVVQ